MTLRLALGVSVLAHLGVMSWIVVHAGRLPPGGGGGPREVSFVLSPVQPAIVRRYRRGKSSPLIAHSPLSLTGPALPPATTRDNGVHSNAIAPSDFRLSLAKVLAEGNAPPEYPEEAARRGWQGVVTVRLWLNEVGMVWRVDVEKSSGYPTLDLAATSAAALWRFSSVYKQNTEKAARVVVPVTFMLESF